MAKPRMCGAFATYTPNNRMDARYNRKRQDKAKLMADNAVPKAERRQLKEKRLSYGL